MKDNIRPENIWLALSKIWAEMPLSDRAVRRHEEWRWHIVRIGDTIYIPVQTDTGLNFYFRTLRGPQWKCWFDDLNRQFSSVSVGKNRYGIANFCIKGEG